MQYLAYKGIKGEWLTLLRGQGSDVFFAPDNDANFDAGIVCVKANEEGRILITGDEAWAERLQRDKSVRTGIVLFKPGKLNELAASKLLADTLRGRAGDLPGNYSVLAKNGLRTKPLVSA